MTFESNRFALHYGDATAVPLAYELRSNHSDPGEPAWAIEVAVVDDEYVMALDSLFGLDLMVPLRMSFPTLAEAARFASLICPTYARLAALIDETRMGSATLEAGT